MNTFEELALIEFLRKRQMPENIMEILFNSPMAPDFLFDLFLEIYAAGELNGANNLNLYISPDIEGRRLSFIQYITND